MIPKDGVYWGRIVHHRFQPKKHLFTYPVFIFSIDLDRLEEWGKKLRLFGHNRFSLYSLRDSDHIPVTEAAKHPSTERPSIKDSVTALLRERGYAGPVDKIFMVTQFRVLGYLFNPVTFYYCYADGKEVAYVAEVNNTFHQRHSYAFFGEGQATAGPGKTFRTDKVFYVSPFLEMDLVYTFRFDPLGEKLGVFVDDYQPGARPEDPETLMIKTLIAGRHAPLTDGQLLLSFLRIPYMSAWIIGWIHWQALKLWLKKVPLVFRPKDGMKPRWKGGA